MSLKHDNAHLEIAFVVPLARSFIALPSRRIYALAIGRFDGSTGKPYSAGYCGRQTAELVFSGDKVKATGRWSSRRPRPCVYA